MKRAMLLLASVLALAACAGRHELAMPGGDWRQLNAGKWTAQQNDLTTSPASRPPAGPI
jgi:hypothetical protein